MYDIFLSYDRNDHEPAKAVVGLLEAHGFSVFWDREIPVGSSWSKVLEKQLESSRCVVVLWSTDSVSSEWVRGEAGHGFEEGILVPALLEKDVKLPLPFQSIQATDLADPASFQAQHPEFRKLLKAVAGKLGQTVPPSPPAPTISGATAGPATTTPTVASELVPLWIAGLVATLEGARRLASSDIDYRGRLALIVLDTVFETGGLVFLEHVASWGAGELGQLIETRSRLELFNELKQAARDEDRPLKPAIWHAIDECHRERNRLAHVSINEDVPPSYLRRYFKTAIQFLNRLFQLKLDDDIVVFGGVLQTEPAVSVTGARAAEAGYSEALLRAAQQYYTGSVQAAVESLTRILQEADPPEAHYLLALCLKKQKKREYTDRAIEEIEQALKSPTLGRDPAIHLDYVFLLNRAGRPRIALAAIEIAEALGLKALDRVEALHLKGFAQRGLCRYAAARRSFARVLEIDEHHRASREDLVESLLNLRLCDEALERVEQFVEDEPANSTFYVLRARAHACARDYEPAFADLDRAWNVSTAKGAKGDNNVPISRAQLLLKRYLEAKPEGMADESDLTQAEGIVRGAIDNLRKPGYRPRFRQVLAKILWERGESGAFEAAYREAQQGTRENRYVANNFSYLAVAALATDRFEEAAKAGRRGLDLARQRVIPRMLVSGGRDPGGGGPRDLARGTEAGSGRVGGSARRHRGVRPGLLRMGLGTLSDCRNDRCGVEGDRAAASECSCPARVRNNVTDRTFIRAEPSTAEAERSSSTSRGFSTRHKRIRTSRRRPSQRPPAHRGRLRYPMVGAGRCLWGNEL